MGASTVEVSSSLRRSLLVLPIALLAAVPIHAGKRRAVRSPSAPEVSGSAPVAGADQYATNGNTALITPAPGVLTNDALNGGAIASYGATSGAEQHSIGSTTATSAGGTISLAADGSFTFTPKSGFSGNDSFRYVLANGAGSSTGTVTIAVSAVVQSPVANADGFVASRNTTLTAPAPGVLANDTLNGASIVSYGKTSGSEQTTIGLGAQTAAGGSITLNGDGGFTFVPASGFSGNDTFKYVLSNSGGSSTGTVTVMVIAPPNAANDSYTTNANTALTRNASSGVLVNDTLSGGAITSYGASSGSEQTTIGSNTATAAGGTIRISADGSFTFTPKSGFTGNDSFKYVLTNSGGSDDATVTIAVTAAFDYEVTTSGFAYVFSGMSELNPTITLERGRTYKFKVSTSSIHPMDIENEPPGSVQNPGAFGGEILTFTVPNAPGQYRYFCTVHDFGGLFNVP